MTSVKDLDLSRCSINHSFYDGYCHFVGNLGSILKSVL